MLVRVAIVASNIAKAVLSACRNKRKYRNLSWEKQKSKDQQSKCVIKVTKVDQNDVDKDLDFQRMAFIN